MVFLNAQSSSQCWKITFKSWHVIVLMNMKAFQQNLLTDCAVKGDEWWENLFHWLFKTNVKTGSIFYEPFVISSISSSTLALRLFLPGTWPVLNNISSLCTSSRERALAIAAWRLKSKTIVKPYLTDLFITKTVLLTSICQFITFNIIQSGHNHVAMPKINAKYELPTLPHKLFEARLSPKFTVAYMYSTQL